MNQKSLYNKWTEVELEERNKEMLEKAVNIWPMAKTEFLPMEEIKEKVSLTEDYDLTGKSISGFEYLGAHTSVKNWKEMYLKMIKLIIEENPQVLINQVNKRENDLKYYFDNRKSKTIYEKIYDGIFVNINTSTDRKITGLRRLFELYELEEDELIFVLKPPKED